MIATQGIPRDSPVFYAMARVARSEPVAQPASTSVMTLLIP